MGTVYKCLIIDDEKPAHLVIQSHISNCENLVYSGSAYNGKEAIKLIQENKYDFIFLDINMPLINGIEVLQVLPQRPVTIITTAYSEHAYDAYQYDAVDYLQKPITFPRFLKSIEKATLLWKTNKDKAQNKSHLNLRHEGEGIEIKMDDISHFQSIGNYIKIFFKVQCKPMTVYDSLKNILSNTASEKFIQTHKSYVLNVDCIKNIEKDRVVLINGINVPLGRKYELLVNKTKNSQ
jgi:DNA-binding LytR/AlgR family response regulator